MNFDRGMHATHTSIATGAALLFLNDSHAIPNSTPDGDGRKVIIIIPPCWTKAELLLGPFFALYCPGGAGCRINPNDLACNPPAGSR